MYTQEMLKQFNDDMIEMERCTTYRRLGNKCEIHCNLGLWSVEGEYGMPLINEATYYFEQYKEAGEYYTILGGKSPTEQFFWEIKS